MTVRGAPLIGAVAAYGLAFAFRDGADAAAAAEMLMASRPTAVNLRWAVERVLRAGPAEAALEEARRIVEEELERSRRIGEVGVRLIESIAERKRRDPVQ